MDSFYCAHIVLGPCYLPEGESHHAVRVLRKQAGEHIRLIDGQGHIGIGRILSADKKQVVVDVQEIHHEEKDSYHLHIAIAPTKHLDRFEWFLEKATELGIHEVTPIITRHSERKRLRQDRMEKTVWAALKQSLQAYVPQINQLTSFSEFLLHTGAVDAKKRIAYLGAGDCDYFAKEIEHSPKTIVLIGPEGGFAEAEYQEAKAAGFKGVHLGKNRLRTETAGLLVTSAWRNAFNDDQL